jgi:hypothetical protein
MSLPISYKQFAENPLATIAFLLVIVVGYLYVDNKLIYNKQLEEHKSRIEKLEINETIYIEKLDKINNKLLECLNSSR